MIKSSSVNGTQSSDKRRKSATLEEIQQAGESAPRSNVPYPETVYVPASFKHDPTKSYEINQRPFYRLRVTDQETARVVAVHGSDGEILGAGCLLNNRHILTCRHVVQQVLKQGDELPLKSEMLEQEVDATLTGIHGLPKVKTKVRNVDEGEGAQNDLALLEIVDPYLLGRIHSTPFASPLRYGGKAYSVMGFPGRDPQGRNAAGFLHASNARGLVQMDRDGALQVVRGFSGAPVWSPSLQAFVGIVVMELSENDISWCIPSQRLCEFYPNLPAYFRIPPEDRPIIHDYELDDPNKELFGLIDDDGQRRLTAVVREHEDDYTVNLFYECPHDKPEPRGQFVTFITYPDFENEGEDAYELFAEVKKREKGPGWVAQQEIYPVDLFTVAAIGDAGSTVLTLDLESHPATPWKGGPQKRKRKTGRR